MPRYKTSSGDIYNIPEEKLQGFLVKYPDAILLEEEGKLNGPAEETAVAGPITEAQQTAVDTESPLEDGSLDLLPTEVFTIDGKNVSKKEFDKYTAIQEAVKTTEQLESEDPSVFDKIGYELFKTKQYVFNALGDIPERAKKVYLETQAVSNDWIKKVAGEDAADFLFGENIPEGSIAYIDPESNKQVLYSENPDKWKELNALNQRTDTYVKSVYAGSDQELGAAADKKYIEVMKQADKLGKEMQYTGAGMTAGFKGLVGAEGYEEYGAADLLAGGFNAVFNVLETAVPAVLTRGASIYPQVAAPMFADYNRTKAETLYPNSENALELLVENNEVEFTTPAILSTIAVQSERLGLKGLSNYIMRAPLASKGILNMARLATVSSGEGMVEVSQGITDTINNTIAQGKTSAEVSEQIVKYIGSDQALDDFLGGFVGQAGVGIGGRAINRALRGGSQGQAKVNTLLTDLEKLKNEKKQAKNKISKDVIQEDIAQKESELKKYIEENKEVSKKLTEQEKQELLNLLDEKDALYSQAFDLRTQKSENSISNKDYGYAIRSINNQAKQKDNRIDEIRQDAAKREIEVIAEKVSKVSKLLGGKALQIFETTEEYIEAVAKDQDVDVQEARSMIGEAEGVFAGAGNIFIDKQQAAKVGNIGVAAHEFLHPVLNALVGDVNQQVEIVNGFEKILSKDQIAKVNEKLEAYKDEKTGKLDPSVRASEYLTIFSNAIINGDIQYNEGIFTRIGDYIRGILGKYGFKNANFETGKGVYNFLKEYNKTIQKEEGISQRALDLIKKRETETGVKVSEVGVLEGLQASQTKLTEEDSTLVGEQVTKIKELQQEGEALAKKYGKDFIKSSTQTRLEQKLTETVEPALNALAENTTKRLYDKIAPDAKRNVSRAEYLESLKADWTSMIINEYDPTKQSVEKFLSTRGNLRANSLAKKLGIEDAEQGGIKKDVTEQKDLMADETTVEIEKAPSKLIDPTDLITNPDRKNKYIEAVKSKIKDLTPKQLSFKALKDLAPEVTAELFGVPLKKIIDATANLSKGDALNAQIFINKNAEKLLKLLPEGAVLGAASDKLIGTSTGVPRKLLEAFYEKQDRITIDAGLFPFVKKKNISKEDFLNTFGIVDGKKDIDFNPRSGEAQAIKGLMSMFGNIMTNTVVRQEMSKQPGTEAAVQDIAAGKSQLQFSTTAQRNEAYRGAKAISEHGVDSKQFKDLNVSKEVKQLLKKLANKKVITGNTFNGIVYEEITSSDIKKYAKELGLDLKVLSNKSAGYDSTKPDIQIKAKREIGDDVIVNLEVKKDKYARFGSVTFRFNFENFDKPKIEIVQNRKIVKPGEIQNEEVFTSILNEAIPYIKEILTTINEIEGTNYNSFPLGSKIKSTTFQKLKQTSAFASLKSIQKGLNSSVIAQHYNKKGNYYIQIGKSGLYYLGEDVYNTGVPRLDVVFSGSINLKRSGIKDGMTTISLRSEPKIKKAGQLKKSNIDLNTKEGVKEFDEKVKTSTFQFSKTAKATKEKILDTQFNSILENKTGIASGKEYSDARAEVVGASKGKFNWFIPPTAEDFVGLLYQFLGKGKEGDKQMAWFKVNLLNPYARAMSAITRERVSIARNYRALKKELKIVPKNLKKKVPGEDFTVEQALRVHIWVKQGYDVPGLDNADRKSINDYIDSRPELVEFADKMILLNKDYAKPKDSWLAGTLTTDMLETLNTTRRAEFLKEWQENVDVVFSDKNLNKIEAAYGSSFRYALENILTRMKTGRNRSYGTDSLTGRVTDWLTNSIGAIMFFNTRSAVLQTLSAVNFINFGSNNILAAGKAFANQKQFWADFKTLYNSDFLVDRRDGLRLNVNESDIADMAKNGGVKGVVAELLKLGFTPTQIADSFAISSGGATFYRNTLNQYLKEGVDPKVAEELAFREFREIAEESQQSSRPDRISAQQAGPLGRIILAFANTPAQYARLMKKAASDLKNGRGDAKTNVSKLIYYGVAQNLIFNAMQQALFAMAFGDDEEEEETEQKKYINIANGMSDSILRGMGISGAIVSVLKNTAKKLIERSENKQPDYAENALMELLKISPPVSSKASKIKNALRSYEWDKDEMYEKGLALDNPAYLAAGNVLSAATNVPLDRVIKKVTNVKDAMDEDVQLWQRIAMIAGWQAWELGIKEEKKAKSKGSSFKSTSFKSTKFK